MPNDVIITGLTETQQMIVELPADLTRNGFPRALLSGSAVLQQDLRANAPVGDGDHSEFPPLHSSVETDVFIEPDGKSGVASTGFGEAGPKALWNEYGHRIVTHSGRDTGKSTTPNPFMRRTAEQSAEAVIDAFCDSLLATVRDEYGN